MMPLSSRSIRTGPGSRGGFGHTTAERLRLTPTYWREWRAAHPEYRAREVERARQNKRQARLARDRQEVEALIAEMELTH